GTSPSPTTVIDSTVAASPPDTFYVDYSLNNGQIYYYRITAVDSSGNESGYSGQVSATPQVQDPLLFEENFDYVSGQLTANSGGANVSGGNWTSHYGSSDFIYVSEGNLAESGYPASDMGRWIEIISSDGEYVNRSFPSQFGDGTKAYAAFLVNFGTVNTTGDYIAHFMGDLGDSWNDRDYKARVWAKRVSPGDNRIEFGLGFDYNTAMYHTAQYDRNQTHLLVVCYEFTAGADVVKLWIDPDISGAEPAS
ncbi:MAG: hypothetical protein GY869_08640, partial [Planctomycetes bacterium]|nr:hypothetical protein [Planctomycetota bacterium]